MEIASNGRKSARERTLSRGPRSVHRVDHEVFVVLHLRRAPHLDNGAMEFEQLLAAELQWVLVRVVRREERKLLPGHVRHLDMSAEHERDGILVREIDEPLDARLV